MALQSIIFKKHVNNAVIPTRAGENEIGYDLTIVEKKQFINNITVVYDTGISVQPPEGYYTEIVPRSSLVKTGWMLANSVGIIDPTYRGTLKIVMIKIYQEAEDFILPFVKFQLIVRKIYTPEILVADILDETERGEGGFGSTDDL